MEKQSYCSVIFEMFEKAFKLNIAVIYSLITTK